VRRNEFDLDSNVDRDQDTLAIRSDRSSSNGNFKKSRCCESIGETDRLLLLLLSERTRRPLFLSICGNVRHIHARRTRILSLSLSLEIILNHSRNIAVTRHAIHSSRPTLRSKNTLGCLPVDKITAILYTVVAFSLAFFHLLSREKIIYNSPACTRPETISRPCLVPARVPAALHT